MSLPTFAFSFVIFLPLLAYSDGGTCFRQAPPTACTVNDSFKISACDLEWKTHKCDEFAQSHPEAALADKLKDCRNPETCESSGSIKNQILMCLSGSNDAWVDTSKFILEFLIGDAGTPSAEALAKLDYFKNCTTDECKVEMLGPFRSYFSDKEIFGTQNPALNSEVPENQNQLHGYSAAVLYRKLLLALKKQVGKGATLDQKFINPWSGQEAKLPLSFDELISQTLRKAGVSDTACYRSEVLAEMRCYAFFSILDPTLLVGASLKIADAAGLARKIAAVPKRAAQLAHRGIDTSRRMLLERKLSKGTIISNVAVGRGKFGAHFVKYADGTEGVWKPNSSVPRFGLETSHGEVAAYQIDNYLGLQKVPVTVEKELAGVAGTVQHKVKDLKELPKNTSYSSDPDELGFFDYLIGNADRRSDNMLQKSQGPVVAIDNGLAFIDGGGKGALNRFQTTVDSYSKFLRLQREVTGRMVNEKNPVELARLQKGIQFNIARQNKYQMALQAFVPPEDVLKKLRNTSYDDWKKVVGNNMTEAQLQDMMKRQKELLQAIENAESRLGADKIHAAGVYSPLPEYLK